MSARDRVAAHIAPGLPGMIDAAQPSATSSLCKQVTPAANGLKSLTNHDENPTEKRGQTTHSLYQINTLGHTVTNAKFHSLLQRRHEARWVGIDQIFPHNSKASDALP